VGTQAKERMDRSFLVADRHCRSARFPLKQPAFGQFV